MGDWYRTPDWDEPARAAFEERLRRARPDNRSQYLRIKALALIETRDPIRRAAGEELLLRLIGEYPDAFDVPVAHEILAETYLEDGRLADAEARYRAAIDAQAVRPGVRSYAALSLAELLIAKGDPASLTEARDLLERSADDLAASPLPPVRVRQELALARLAWRRGDLAEARTSATRALQIAAEPPNPRWGSLGAVSISEKTMAELRRMARAD